MDSNHTAGSGRIGRRSILQGTAALAAAGSLPRMAAAADDIRVGTLLDVSGPFEAYGKPMDMATDLALAEINDAGGLLGRPLARVGSDTQSDMALYTQYVQQMVRGEGIDVMHGGILSASREAIRPTLRRRSVPYFYNVLYEGGVCDRNFFCTGITPAQQVAALVPYAIREFGPKIYVLAADYNYGQIQAGWVKHYAERSGGRILSTDFFALDVSDFASTITSIQDAKPDMVMSVLVGAAHLSFYRQWAGAGMKQRIPMASTTLGVGLEHVVLTPEEGDDILVAYNYAKSSNSSENRAFLDAWSARYGDDSAIHEIGVSQYQGIHLWANMVRAGGALDAGTLADVAEQGDVFYAGPSGLVAMDGQTHHASLDAHIMRVKNQQLVVLESFSRQPPSDTQDVCNLLANPDDNQQYVISF